MGKAFRRNQTFVIQIAMSIAPYHHLAVKPLMVTYNLGLGSMLPRYWVRATLSCSSGGVPYNGLYGEVPPQGGALVRPQIYKRVGISLAEVY